MGKMSLPMDYGKVLSQLLMLLSFLMEVGMFFLFILKNLFMTYEREVTDEEVSTPDEAGERNGRGTASAIRELTREEAITQTDALLGQGQYANEGLTTRVTNALCRHFGAAAIKIGNGVYYAEETKL